MLQYILTEYIPCKTKTMEETLTTRRAFRDLMADRRQFARGTYEHEYLTRTGRKLIWIMRGVPVNNWPE